MHHLQSFSLCLLEKCIKFVNKNAYIQTAIHGHSFCKGELYSARNLSSRKPIFFAQCVFLSFFTNRQMHLEGAKEAFYLILRNILR
jgi:hypothetical protein